MRILGVNNFISFKRRPTKEEEPELKAAVNDAYDLIGAKDRVVITHGSCFPALKRDTNIGSPYGKAAQEYIKFLTLYGFNGNQLGPVGELEDGKPSPYNSSAFAKNRLFIDLEPLTTEKYGKILSKETYNKYTQIPEKNNKNYTNTDFIAAEITYDKTMKEAFKTFKANLAKGQPEAIALNKEFENFLEKHDERVSDEGVFKVLTKKYGTDDYSKWDDDETLITDIKNGDLEAINRYAKIYSDNKNSIEQYKFEQFIATKQIKENKEWRDEIGFSYINDLLVGCSKMDAWRYEDAFLKDWEMGAREGGGMSQRWRIPIIDPKKIMIDDKLNIGGKFLQEKIEFALEFCENLRIDHAMGLIEPYILSKHAKDEEFSKDGNKNHLEMYISSLRNPQNPHEEYDAYWDYPKLLENIVLPILQKHNIDQNEPVWEDLCSNPDRFRNIYYEKHHLPGLTSLEWARAENAVPNSPNNWFLMGSHDTAPAMTYMQGEHTRNNAAWNPEYLAGYLNMDDSRENIQEIRSQKAELYKNNDNERTFAKFAELMTTPKFQISFDDLLGITEVIYNVPGSTREENWKERIPADFLDKYYENLSSDNPTALNIPGLLRDALQAKIDMEVKAHNYDEDFKREIYEKSQPVLDKLEHYGQVLKEKEN